MSSSSLSVTQALETQALEMIEWFVLVFFPSTRFILTPDSSLW